MTDLPQASKLLDRLRFALDVPRSNHRDRWKPRAHCRRLNVGRMPAAKEVRIPFRHNISCIMVGRINSSLAAKIVAFFLPTL
jgi:hypothetical protein